ncbi:MAG: DMT family transporter [Alphaproteobacteria bacterium]
MTEADRPRPSWHATVASALFVCLWSSAFIAARAGLPDVSPLYFLTLRFAIATASLIAIGCLWPQPWRQLKGRWHHFIVAGALINAVYLGAAYIAMTRISAATMALIGSLHPLLVAVLSGPILGDRFRPAQWLGFGFGIAGVALTVGVEAREMGLVSGITWAFAGVCGMVIGTLYYSRHCRAAAVLPSNTIQLGSAAVICAVATAGFETAHAHWTPVALGTLAYLSLAISLGGMALLLFMLRIGTAGKVAANFYLTPGVTAVLGWLVLGEVVSALAVLGLLLASAGVWLVNRGVNSRQRAS